MSCLIVVGRPRALAVSAVFLLFAFLLASEVLVRPAWAGHDTDYSPEVSADWETTEDGGMSSDDVGRYSVASRSRNNSVETLFVTALRVKSSALQAIGIDDWDVVTSAFDVATGAVRWTTAYDAGLGIFDQPAGIELNYNNNSVYVVVDSDADTSVVPLAVSSGSEGTVTTLPGAKINGTTISVSGSEMGLAGQKNGLFYFADYETGPRTVTIDSSTVSGEAYDVAIHNKTWINSQGNTDWAPGNTTSWRTFVVTGRSGNFGSANMHTAAYRMDQSGHSPVWVSSWNGPDADWDEGLAVETGYLTETGQSLAWTAGRTRDASGNWDIVVRAHDLDTGAAAWAGDVRVWAGAGGTEDEPVAMWFSNANRTLYVTGTTDRGSPHGRDIVTLAYDAASGTFRGAAFSSGDISNGDDHPTAITATHDASHVFVAAEFHDLLPQGGGKYRAGLFAFDGYLSPAGSAVLAEGGFGVDQAGGVAIDIDQTAVLLGGSTDPDTTNRQDLTGASFPLDDFVVLPEPATAMSIAVGSVLLAVAGRRRRGPSRPGRDGPA